ncbi:integration host factor, actinobacterial type [Actinomycetospora straminea]|uniref:Integration host factor-like helix-two turn-helix domain-containing protein n=1 Tax=Actinomycetospora straminea TaxID=663607 RepID=A0ABP9EMY8_9PSEU|nr:integration host factor, actinobacterial type [Actinomycetospora straminea]MDD7936759.1 integration host factor, actinobacterial type [Actinomycetospora straminea]
MSGWVLGIDFGTTSTVAALRLPSGPATGRVDLVSLGNRPPQLPSAVFCDDTGTMRVGPHIPAGAPALNIERTPKRWVGRGRVPIGAVMADDRDLVATVLGFVGEEARRATNGHHPARVVLTHPATWQAAKQRRVTEAAARAHLPEPELVAEPVAAAGALLERGAFHDLPDDALVAVYDLGGGTLDLSLLRYRDHVFTLIGEPSGHEELGGEYLDQQLFTKVVDDCADQERELLANPPLAGQSEARWREAAATLRNRVRDAKENLKYVATTQIMLPEVIESRRSYTITQDELRTLATPMISRTIELLDTGLLKRNGHTTADLSAICLVGGGSKLALVPRLLEEHFGCPIAAHGDLATLVATGAALNPAPQTAPSETAVGSTSPTYQQATGQIGQTRSDSARTDSTSKMRSTAVSPTSPAPSNQAGSQPTAADKGPRFAGGRPSKKPTEAERPIAVEASAIARRSRAELKEMLKHGKISVSGAIERAGSDEAIARMKILELLRALPGVGKVRAQQLIERLEVAPTQRVGGLSERQRKALLGEFAQAESEQKEARSTPAALSSPPVHEAQNRPRSELEPSLSKIVSWGHNYKMLAEFEQREGWNVKWDVAALRESIGSSERVATVHPANLGSIGGVVLVVTDSHLHLSNAGGGWVSPSWRRLRESVPGIYRRSRTLVVLPLKAIVKATAQSDKLVLQVSPLVDLNFPPRTLPALTLNSTSSANGVARSINSARQGRT